MSYRIMGDHSDNKTMKLLELARERMVRLTARDFKRTDANQIDVATQKFNEWFIGYANEKDLALMAPWVKEDIDGLKEFNKLILNL